MEKWVRIGEVLRQARESKQMSIDELAQKVGIPEWKIRLIEEGQFDRVDAPFYVKYYIKSCAEFLGLDPAQLLGQFEPKPIETQEKTKKIVVNGGLISLLLLVIFAASVIFFAYSAWKFFTVLRSPKVQLVNQSDHPVYFNERPLAPGERVDLQVGQRYRISGNVGVCSVLSTGKEWKIRVENFEVVVWEK
ncbi:MAG TPA: helix-turn-helix domain-containing protein [Pseudothermotoga sp.]